MKISFLFTLLVTKAFLFTFLVTKYFQMNSIKFNKCQIFKNKYFFFTSKTDDFKFQIYEEFDTKKIKNHFY